MTRQSFLLPALASLALLTTTVPALAADSTPDLVSDKEKLRHETTGVVGGAVIGGLVGGPVGVIVSAGLGAWISDLTIARKENTLMAQSMEDQQRELLALQAEYRALEARYQVAAREMASTRMRNASLNGEAFGTRNTQAACCSDAELSLHFKTGSATIEKLYDAKLNEFASLVESLPEAVIEITGHADRRGNDAANLALSQRRIQAVEQRLGKLGVRNKSMQTSAFGESRPATETDNFENNFFDRRVVVRVVSAGNGMLTRAND